MAFHRDARQTVPRTLSLLGLAALSISDDPPQNFGLIDPLVHLSLSRQLTNEFALLDGSGELLKTYVVDVIISITGILSDGQRSDLYNGDRQRHL